MGIEPTTLAFLDTHVPRPQRMAELGNQHCHGIPGVAVAKHLFTARGVEHHSLDLNGQDEARRVDFTHPTGVDDLLGRCDVVTDFGTSEHAHDWYAVQRFVWSLLTPTGWYVGALPETGSWPGHGYWWFREETFRALGDFYRGARPRHRHASMHNTTDGWSWYFALQRTPESAFPDRTNFLWWVPTWPR